MLNQLLSTKIMWGWRSSITRTTGLQDCSFAYILDDRSGPVEDRSKVGVIRGSAGSGQYRRAQYVGSQNVLKKIEILLLEL
jgi:hypothetical protein